MTNKIKDLAEHGQSLWYDNISRDLLNSGTIQALVDDGILGMTSNPAIFMKAITNSSVYDEHIRELAQQGLNTQGIYEKLAIQDIQRAADILRPVYDETNGSDGFISLEVSPFLATDTAGTSSEVVRLARLVDRPNLMIKIPATLEGLPAIRDSIAAGYDINVTLIFSRDVYKQVMDAYLTGLEQRLEDGHQLEGVASVASFFVSRVDSKVDKQLENTGTPEAQALQGKAAVANARLAYQLFKGTFESDRFKRLASHGANVQRPLWASTSTKNPAYRDVLYIEELIGPHTVNTAPPHTIDAFIDHGVIANTLEKDVEDAYQTMSELTAAGIDMDVVTDTLLKEGVTSFAKAFQDLLDAVEAKQLQFASEKS